VKRHRSEIRIKDSRFVAAVGHTETVADAKRFIEGIQTEFADATHNCWAYVAAAGQTGMSDAGEPRGTAGRPMLIVLEHSGIDEITAVVTRYFGGTKLGRGGLVRAYSRCVSEALETLPTEKKVAMEALSVTVAYTAAESIKNLCVDMGGKIVAAEYGADVFLQMAVPAAQKESLVQKITGVTSGKAIFA
jgi:uncharacterized YigZ family protein